MPLGLQAEAAARARGRRRSAAWAAPGDAGGRAPRRGDQPRSRRRGARGALPRGSLLPAQRHRLRAAAAARAAAKTCCRWPAASCSGTERAKRLSPAATRALQNYPWPGNVRELANAMERARLLSRTDVILPEHLPPPVRAGAAAGSLSGATARGRRAGRPPTVAAERDRCGGGDGSCPSTGGSARNRARPRPDRRATVPAPPSCWASADAPSSTSSSATGMAESAQSFHAQGGARNSCTPRNRTHKHQRCNDLHYGTPHANADRESRRWRPDPRFRQADTR